MNDYQLLALIRLRWAGIELDPKLQTILNEHPERVEELEKAYGYEKKA